MGVHVRFRRGNWWVFVEHMTRRKAKQIGPGEEGKRLAEQVADRLRIRIAFGEGIEDPPPEAPDFETYAETWLRNISVLRRVSTWEVYTRHMRNIWIPALGKKRVDAITRADVKRVLIGLQKNRQYSRVYCLSILTALQSCLSEAMDEEIIGSNPALRQARNIARPKVDEEDAPELVVFTEAEVRAILQGALERWPDMHPKILILARTGMREGEMLILQSADLDFARARIAVRRTWGSRNTGQRHRCIGLPKGGRRRYVEMSPQLSEVLKAYLERRPAGSPWLFPGSGPQFPMQPSGFLYMWKRVLQHAGVAYRKPHALRHYYASMMIHRGVDVIYIRDQLGHSSTKITLDFYGHLMHRQEGSRAVLMDDDNRNLSATRRLRLLEANDGSG